MRVLTIITMAFAATLAAPGFAEVITSEFLSVPLEEGWTLGGQWGDLTTWVDGGVYYQDFANDCEPGPVCGSQSLDRSIQVFNGQPHWFFEYRVSATGDHTEIPNGAPTVLAAGNFYGNLYRAGLASDQVKLQGDADLPILFYDIEPGVPHTIRLELLNDPPPATYHWYVDSVLVLEGLADSPFPDYDSRIGWTGRTWMQPTLNAWYYIRAGDIPMAASGDFDSDGEVDLFDYFYFAECTERSASGDPAFPSCTWADMDENGEVNLRDFAAFQNAFTGSD